MLPAADDRVAATAVPRARFMQRDSCTGVQAYESSRRPLRARQAGNGRPPRADVALKDAGQASTLGRSPWTGGRTLPLAAVPPSQQGPAAGRFYDLPHTHAPAMPIGGHTPT